MQVKKVNNVFVVTPENMEEEACIHVIDYNRDANDGREPYEAAVVDEENMEEFWREFLIAKTIGNTDSKVPIYVREIEDITYLFSSIAVADKFYNLN